MRVLLTRSAANCRNSASRLEAAGHAAVVLPLLAYVPLATALPQGRFDAVAFTSAAGVESAVQYLARHGDAADLLVTPAYCVGKATAQAALEAGFERIVTGTGGGTALARLIASNAPKWTANPSLLHFAGTDKAFDFSAGLAGWRVVEMTGYEAQLLDPGKLALEASLAVAQAILLYSPRTAAHLAEISIRHGNAGQLAGLTLIAISEKTARALQALVQADVLVAARPDEAAMIELLSGISPANIGQR